MTIVGVVMSCVMRAEGEATRVILAGIGRAERGRALRWGAKIAQQSIFAPRFCETLGNLRRAGLQVDR